MKTEKKTAWGDHPYFWLVVSIIGGVWLGAVLSLLAAALW